MDTVFKDMGVTPESNDDDTNIFKNISIKECFDKVTRNCTGISILTDNTGRKLSIDTIIPMCIIHYGTIFYLYSRKGAHFIPIKNTDGTNRCKFISEDRSEMRQN